MIGVSAVQPKRPPTGNDSPWVQVPIPREMPDTGYPIEAWISHSAAIYVLTSVEVVSAQEGELIGPEYHISISRASRNGPRRVMRADALWVLEQFGLEDATEDNHVPHGVVRNFWRPVADHLSGHVCPCQDSEPAIREDKGDFVWRPAP